MEHDDDIIAQLIGIIGTYGEIRNEVVSLYFQAMTGCTVSELAVAAVEWMRDEEKCHRRPKPGDLWRLILSKRPKALKKNCFSCSAEMPDRNASVCENCDMKIHNYLHDLKMSNYMAQFDKVWPAKEHDEYIVAYCDAHISHTTLH